MIQILECISDGSSTRTKIMFKAYLSFAQAKDYLGFLQAKGLVEQEGNSSYRITSNGRDFLHKCSEISSILSIEGYETPQPDPKLRL
jgi:predicted transcriptional regulator